MTSNFINSNTIYVKLLDEGVNVWRPVNASHVHHDIWRIDEQKIPESETWEFLPGQQVVVEGKEFHDGRRGLVAIAIDDGNLNRFKMTRGKFHLLSLFLLRICLMQLYSYHSTGCVRFRGEYCGDGTLGPLVVTLLFFGAFPAASLYVFLKEWWGKK